MWLLSVRELQHRIRRVLLAVAVVAVVFAIAVAVDGVKRTIEDEPGQLSDLLAVDGWVVQGVNRSPFAAMAVLPEATVDTVAALPGVRSVHPVVDGFATVISPERVNANVVGFDAGPDRPDWIPLSAGRMPRAPREVVATTDLGVPVGRTIETTAGRLEVVGLTERGTFNAGAPTLFTSVRTAQKAVLAGNRYVTGVGFTGRVDRPPAGTSVGTNADTVADLRLTVASAATTIDVIALLTWLVAAGVIGAITYLNVIEQTRTFAILRATGSSARLVVGSIVVQSMTVSVAAAVVAVPFAFGLRLVLPEPSTITLASVTRIVAVGFVVGIVASLAAARRAIAVDPATAFGGA